MRASYHGFSSSVSQAVQGRELSEEQKQAIKEQESEEQIIEEARRDVNVFAEYCFGIKQADIHRQMQGRMGDSDHRYNIIEVPRFHGKTTQGWIRILFEIGNNPNKTFKIVCEGDKQAFKRHMRVKEEIEKNDRLRKVFPHLIPGTPWGAAMLNIFGRSANTEPTLESRGVLTSATGGRADEILFDDPVGMKTAIQNPAMRKMVSTKINGDWLNFIDATTGRANVLCTGWTTADWIHEAKKNPMWRLLRVPCDGFFSPWPEKWTEAALREKLALINQVEFDRGFKLIPLSGEIVPINPDWIQYWQMKPAIENLIIFDAYDLSTGVQGGDYFSCVTIGLDPTPPGTYYVLNAWHARISILTQIQRVVSQTIAVRPNYIGIETTQYQAVLPELVNAWTSGLPRITSLKPVVAKHLRLSTVSGPIEQGRVLFNPRLKPERIRNPEAEGDLIGELTTFPLGRYDDLVDAFVYAMMMAMEYVLIIASKQPKETPQQVSDSSPQFSGSFVERMQRAQW